MQLGDLIQDRFVKCAAHQPAFAAVTEKVALAQILDCPLLTRDGRLYRGASRVATIIGPAQL